MNLPLTELQGMGALPGLDMQFVMQNLAQLFLASLRIGSFLLAAPFFGGSFVPLQVRIIISVLLGISVMSMVEVPSIETFGQMKILAVVCTEIVIGVAAGLILTIWLSAAMVAGEKIATSAGLGYAAQIDPEGGGQTPVVSKMLQMFVTVLFLSLNGHLIVLRTMMESYRQLPVGETPHFGALIEGGIAAFGHMFLVASLIMLPIAITLLLVNLAIGVMTRSAPQLNLFSFGFPITMLGVFILLYLSVDSIAFALNGLAISAMDNLEVIMGRAIYG
ncbi:flagellar biosynthetic protein FliR [Alphaproteobacteria bacterium]|jgi:flagellar biosynthetic protein FliR|nr:flagellar biosynthetic protein FliR [Tateyamaria sp.]MDA9672545.1 flagellar biosynthetic protein FliR [Alphaproteobacteria bacterium]